MKFSQRRRYGRLAEDACVRALAAEGYQVVRTHLSQGAADVIAWNAQHFLLVQVKATADQGVVSLSRYKADLAALRDTSVPSNCQRQLWLYQNGAFTRYEVTATEVSKVLERATFEAGAAT